MAAEPSFRMDPGSASLSGADEADVNGPTAPPTGCGIQVQLLPLPIKPLMSAGWTSAFRPVAVESSKDPDAPPRR